MKSLLIFSFTAFICLVNAQVVCDGIISDWYNQATAVSVDDSNSDGSNLDFINLSASNDGEFLFIKLQVKQETSLNFGDDVVLYLDTDANLNSGNQFDVVGAELVWNFQNNQGFLFENSGTSQVEFKDLHFRALPSFASKNFEIAISRFADLQFGKTIKIKIEDAAGSDQIPDAGQSLVYTFNDNLNFTPKSWEKQNNNHLRLLSWNTEFDGLLDNSRAQAFETILEAIKPQIIAFQEVWDMTAQEAENFVATIFPNENWYAAKNEDNNIVVSQFPILQNHNVLQNHRLQAVLLDLPNEVYEEDLLLVNAHFRCCGADAERQLEADAFANFVFDMRFGQGPFSIANGTPIVLTGDLNLVGESMQLQTILTGEIVNTQTFGQLGPLDWDDSNLTDLAPTQSDLALGITWRNDNGGFLPGRLDYLIYTDQVLEIPNSFIIQTEEMSNARLQIYGLNGNETSTASDHFPIVADLQLNTLTSAETIENTGFAKVWISNHQLYIQSKKLGNVEIYNLEGKQISIFEKTNSNETFPLNNSQEKILIIKFDGKVYKVIAN